ncbi:peptidase domain-containing ABC transporter [Staphylococcus epidermidis]|nr:peptidase domain-containing ABC transporter [Staphylococcus epidermidis]
MGIKFIEQYNEKDCGPVCLAMLAKYYNKDISISKLREWSETDKEGTSLYGMVEAGRRIGINLTGVSVNDVNEIDDASLPLIAHIINEKGYYHFVIVEKIKKDKFIIIDPSEGKRKISKNYFETLWTNILLLVENDETKQVTDIKLTSNKKIFLDMLNNNKKMILYIVLLSFLINILGIVGTFYFRLLVDKIIPEKTLFNLNILSLSVIGLYFINLLSSYIRYQISLKLSLNIDISFMKKYFEHVLHLPIKFYENRKSGEILSRFNDISHIRDALSSVTITLLVDTFMVIVGGCLLFIQSPLLLLISVVLIPIYLLIGLSFRNVLRKYNKLVMEQGAETDSFLIESFSGHYILKSYNLEKYIFEKGKKYFVDLVEKIYKLGKMTNIQMSLNNFMKLTISLVIIWIGSILIIQGKLTLGELLTFNALVVYYLDPIERLINLQPTIESATAASRRFLDILDINTEKTIQEKAKYKSDYSFDKYIKFENVSFKYGFQKETLKNINLTIKKNQKVAIVGESGSGKSTIAKLLENFYSNFTGKILIDDSPINDFYKDDLREMISFVTQENFIFGDSIRNNLVLDMDDEKSTEEIMKACEIACIKSFIEDLPQGLDTKMYNGGNGLSGGQLQRISIARALLKNSDIILLDEITSALDSVTAQKIISNIDRLIGHKTIIIISHNLSYIKNADIIYTLKKGSICEHGKHSELLENKKEYYHLWYSQNGNSN